MTIRVNPENERTAVLDDAHVGDLSLGHRLSSWPPRGRHVIRAAAIGLIALALQCADPFPSDRLPLLRDRRRRSRERANAEPSDGVRFEPPLSSLWRFRHDHSTRASRIEPRQRRVPGRRDRLRTAVAPAAGGLENQYAGRARRG